MKSRQVIRSAGVVGSFTLLSRGLGMLRDIIIAYHFGTSVLASAFFVAFTLPNLFRRLFGEGALSAAFIPVFVETRKKEGDSAAWDMAAKVVTMTAALLSVISIIGVVLFSIASQIPGMPEKWHTTFELSRVMFPYVLLICMAALSMAVLNSFKHFATSAFAPCLLNLILIVFMLILFPMVSTNIARANVLAWGVLLAGAAQVAIQIPALKRFGCPFKFTNKWNDPKVRKMLMLMGPAALGMAVTQFNVLADRLLAMWIGDWAPAALFYSERMIYFPLGIIATAMGTVLLPTFSSHAADDNQDAMGEMITHSLRQLSFIMTPAALGLLALAPSILTAVFEWGGSFSEDSTLLSARALMFYAPGLIIFSAAKVFVPAFYAMQDTRTPVRIGIWIVVVNLAMNITFILTLPEYWKHAGMAFSTVLAEGIGMTVLGFLLARKIKHIEWKQIFIGFVRNLFCAVVMAATAWTCAKLCMDHFEGILPVKVVGIGSVVVAVLAGAATYFVLSILLKAPELREIKAALRK